MAEILYESQKILRTINSNNIKIKTSVDVDNLEQIKNIKDKPQEHFIVIALNSANVVLSIELVGIGSVNCIPINISDVLRSVLTRGACKLIVAHNHPSGINEPSKQDIYFTKKLNNACALVGVQLLDHIIVAEKNLSMVTDKYLDNDVSLIQAESEAINELRKENARLHQELDKKTGNQKSIHEKIKSVQNSKETKSRNKSKKIQQEIN